MIITYNGIWVIFQFSSIVNNAARSDLEFLRFHLEP